MTVFEHSMDPQQCTAGRQDTLAVSTVPGCGLSSSLQSTSSTFSIAHYIAVCRCCRGGLKRNLNRLPRLLHLAAHCCAACPTSAGKLPHFFPAAQSLTMRASASTQGNGSASCSESVTLPPPTWMGTLRSEQQACSVRKHTTAHCAKVGETQFQEERSRQGLPRWAEQGPLAPSLHARRPWGRPQQASTCLHTQQAVHLNRRSLRSVCPEPSW